MDIQIKKRPNEYYPAIQSKISSSGIFPSICPRPDVEEKKKKKKKKEEKKERRKKEKRNLSKKRKRHKNNNTAVKHWSPLSSY